MTRDMAKLGLAAFVQSASDGSLGGLSSEQMMALAAGASSDPDVASEAFGGKATPGQIQKLVIDECLSQRFAGVGDSISAGRRDRFARMRSDRLAAVFGKAGIGPDEAASISFDAENGNPSRLNQAKTRYFFE